MKLADRVREARLEAGLGMNELDRRIGQPHGGYTTRLEAGEKKRPDPAVLNKIADALNVRLEWLLSGDLPKREGSPQPRTSNGGTVANADPAIGTFLLKLDRLPGLRGWLEEHPAELSVSQVAKGIAIYEQVKPKAREDGQPHDGWGAFFRDALSDRLTRKLPGSVEAAEELERRELESMRRTSSKRQKK